MTHSMTEANKVEHAIESLVTIALVCRNTMGPANSDKMLDYISLIERYIGKLESKHEKY